MHLFLPLGAALAALLGVYLLVALFRPEMFE